MQAANMLVHAKAIGLPIASGLPTEYEPEPKSGVTSLRDFAALRVARAVAAEEKKDYIGDEEEAHPDEYEFTPPIHAEFMAKVEGGLDDDDAAEVGDEDAALEYDENGNPIRILGYIPGLTPHPSDVREAVTTIGSVKRGLINPAARVDRAEDANHYGRSRLLAVVLRLQPDGLFAYESENSSPMGTQTRFEQAADFLIRCVSNKELDENSAFNLVSEALLNVWGSKWQQHLDDDIVQDVTNLLLNEDATAEDLIVAMKAIDLSKDFETYRILTQVAGFADDYGDQARKRGKNTNLDAYEFLENARMWKEDHNRNQTDYSTFLTAMDMAESWPEAFILTKILQLSAGEKVDFYEITALAERKAIARKKAKMLAKINMLRELMQTEDGVFSPAQDSDHFLQSLMQLAKCENLDAAHSKINKVLKPHMKRS